MEAKSAGEVEEEAVYQQDLEHAEWELKRHNTLLEWTEQERLRMDSKHSAPTAEECLKSQDAVLQAVQRSERKSRRKRQLEAPTIRGEVEVSQLNLARQSTPRLEPKNMECVPAFDGLNTDDNAIVLQAQRGLSGRAPRTKAESLHHQLCPHRVSKIRRYADTNMKSCRKARRNRQDNKAQCKSRQSPYQPQPLHINVRTRSGRVIQRPERWGFPTDTCSEC